MPNKEVTQDFHFPIAGIDRSDNFGAQKPRQIAEGLWARTTIQGVNVVGFEPTENRARGGSRSGLTRYIDARVAGVEFVIQDLNVCVSGGTAVQLSQSGRVVTLVAVSEGNVFVARAGATTWSTTTNTTGNTPPLNFSGVMFSAPNVQNLYFADGVNQVYYNPRDDTVNLWTASAGSLPTDSDNNKPFLICTWRGRTVQAGLPKDQYNWFMSAVDDPRNWDYAPVNFTPTQAVAGANAPQGLMGDVITSLCPYNDDVLIFFGDHSIYQMRGDPADGGKVDLITNTIGGTFGICWAMDPYGTVYFVSNKMGIYTFVPGQSLPQRISQPIEQLLTVLNTGTTGIRLIWDDQFQGLHVFLTTLTEPTLSDYHLFFEQRTQAWWITKFGNPKHNPLCCCIFDGNLPEDRVALVGCWDGYVRNFLATAVDDDGTKITSQVFLGPIVTPNLDEITVRSLQGVMGANSGDVTVSLRSGRTAEEAYSALPKVPRVWGAGRSVNEIIERANHAHYISIDSNVPWQMEQIRVILDTRGPVRARGR